MSCSNILSKIISYKNYHETSKETYSGENMINKNWFWVGPDGKIDRQKLW